MMTLIMFSLSLSLSLSLPPIPTACMREQLAQALASQQALIIERDQAKEQCKLAQDRASKLQRQLDLLRKVHSKSEASPLQNYTEMLVEFWCTKAWMVKTRCSPSWFHSLMKQLPRVLSEFGQTSYYCLQFCLKYCRTFIIIIIIIVMSFLWCGLPP